MALKAKTHAVSNIEEVFFTYVLGRPDAMGSADSETAIRDYGPPKGSPYSEIEAYERRIVGKTWDIFRVDIRGISYRPIADVLRYLRLKREARELPRPRGRLLPFEIAH